MNLEGQYREREYGPGRAAKLVALAGSAILASTPPIGVGFWRQERGTPVVPMSANSTQSLAGTHTNTELPAVPSPAPVATAIENVFQNQGQYVPSELVDSGRSSTSSRFGRGHLTRYASALSTKPAHRINGTLAENTTAIAANSLPESSPSERLILPKVRRGTGSPHRVTQKLRAEIQNAATEFYLDEAAAKPVVENIPVTTPGSPVYREIEVIRLRAMPAIALPANDYNGRSRALDAARITSIIMPASIT